MPILLLPQSDAGGAGAQTVNCSAATLVSAGQSATIVHGATSVAITTRVLAAAGQTVVVDNFDGLTLDAVQVGSLIRVTWS